MPLIKTLLALIPAFLLGLFIAVVVGVAKCVAFGLGYLFGVYYDLRYGKAID